MTLLEWKSSRHMRLKPTTSRRMYSTSETTDSHRTPAGRREVGDEGQARESFPNRPSP